MSKEQVWRGVEYSVDGRVVAVRWFEGMALVQTEDRENVFSVLLSSHLDFPAASQGSGAPL